MYEFEYHFTHNVQEDTIDLAFHHQDFLLIITHECSIHWTVIEEKKVGRPFF